MTSATLTGMETDGTLNQELAAWRATTHPGPTAAVYRCPWGRCCWHTTDRPTLHDHIDRRHGGCAP